LLPRAARPCQQAATRIRWASAIAVCEQCRGRLLRCAGRLGADDRVGDGRFVGAAARRASASSRTHSSRLGRRDDRVARWLSGKPERSSTSCAFANKVAISGCIIRSPRCHSARLSGSHEAGENGGCQIRVGGLVCPTATSDSSSAAVSVRDQCRHCFDRRATMSEAGSCSSPGATAASRRRARRPPLRGDRPSSWAVMAAC
jgi:hypothetical protein